MKLDDLIIAANTPASAYTEHVQRLQSQHILVRPWIPSGTTPGGIVWRRRDTNPPVWGWLLACTKSDANTVPELRPGCMVIFRRHSGDRVGVDTPLTPDPDEVGLRWKVLAIHLDSLDAVIDPPNVPLVW